jgi:hypothetical protein
MCTIVIASRVFEGAPLVVAANRDEAFARPAEGPEIRDFGAGPVLSPLDLQAGGSWVGLNPAGIFVGLTNRQTDAPDPHRRSRGELVARFLGVAELDEAREMAEATVVEQYNPFHLAVVGTTGGFVLWNDGDRSRRYELEPGVHVLTERFAGGAAGSGARRGTTTRPERVQELTQAWTGGSAPSNEQLQRLLGDHRGSGFEDLRVAIEGFGYGTRSALTLRLGAEPQYSSFTWSEGPPRDGSFVTSANLCQTRRPCALG